MTDDHLHPSSPLECGDASESRLAPSRRDFLRIAGLGGSLALLPGIVVACGEDSPTAPGNALPGSGAPLLVDFAQGDVAILQFAYVLEQIESDFYGRVVAAFGTSNITAADQAVLTDVRNHEVAHREFLKALLGENGRTATATFAGVDFSSRSEVLEVARALEDLGVAAYNGAAQYVTAPDNLLALSKIVSVEARHAAVIRDLINPRSIEFAPASADDVFRPAKIAAAVQPNLVDKLAFANAPATFVQGPRGNG